MPRGRCDIVAVPRPRSVGVEVSTTIRLDYSAAVELIEAIAATINMRVTLTPITGSEDGGGQ